MVNEFPNISMSSRWGICDAAHLLGIDRSTLNRYVDSRKVKVHYNRRNGRKCFTGDDLYTLWKSEKYIR